MPNYKDMYYKLFNSTSKAISILQQAQRETEEMYVNSEEAGIVLLNNEKEEESKK